MKCSPKPIPLSVRNTTYRRRSNGFTNSRTSVSRGQAMAEIARLNLRYVPHRALRHIGMIIRHKMSSVTFISPDATYTVMNHTNGTFVMRNHDAGVDGLVTNTPLRACRVEGGALHAETSGEVVLLGDFPFEGRCSTLVMGGRRYFCANRSISRKYGSNIVRADGCIIAGTNV